ncbi:hypothetical protein [Ruegeria lacuscaerulensis]|uniref:hypothetical protein n=1 Tax=Ruegeria lacuscaerulensis TaxID=55218 RepID=UPI001BE42106|nr:hypothetical protein [Ruegeria lacuscaerulensis]
MTIAIQLKEELPPKSSGRNSAHFVNIEKSNHLSEEGIQAVYALFEKGHSCEEVAQIIGISVRGAQNRYKIWRTEQGIAEVTTKVTVYPHPDN